MTPYEIMCLAVAPVGNDGAPRCAPCAPVAPSGSYMPDFNAAPEMVVDAAQPALCLCPECGHKAQTPTPLAVAILAERIATLEARHGAV